MAALARVAKASKEQAAIFVLKDIANLIAPLGNGQISSNQLPLVRELKNLAQELVSDRRCAVLVGCRASVPLELREELTVINFSLPSVGEIGELVNSLVNPENLRQQRARNS